MVGGRLFKPLLGLSLILAGIAFAVPRISAGAAPNPTPAVSFTASVAPGQNRLQIDPGQSAQVTMYATSNLSTPFLVTVFPSQVKLGDNGNAALQDHPDARFAGLITISPQTFLLPPNQTLPVVVTIAIPKAFPADTYVLGFGFVPQIAGSGNVKVISELALLVEVTVPGSLHLEPTLEFSGLKGFSLATGNDQGALKVTETGSQSSFVTSEVTLTGQLGAADPSDFRFPQTLVASHHYRLFNFTWHPVLGIGIFQVKGTLTYNITAQTSAQKTITQTVVVIHPLWLLTLLIPIYGVWRIVRWLRRVQRSKPERRTSKSRAR